MLFTNNTSSRKCISFGNIKVIRLQILVCRPIIILTSFSKTCQDYFFYTTNQQFTKDILFFKSKKSHKNLRSQITTLIFEVK